MRPQILLEADSLPPHPLLNTPDTENLEHHVCKLENELALLIRARERLQIVEDANTLLRTSKKRRQQQQQQQQQQQVHQVEAHQQVRQEVHQQQGVPMVAGYEPPHSLDAEWAQYTSQYAAENPAQYPNHARTAAELMQLTLKSPPDTLYRSIFAPQNKRMRMGF